MTKIDKAYVNMMMLPFLTLVIFLFDTLKNQYSRAPSR